MGIFGKIGEKIEKIKNSKISQGIIGKVGSLIFFPFNEMLEDFLDITKHHKTIRNIYRLIVSVASIITLGVFLPHWYPPYKDYIFGFFSQLFPLGGFGDAWGGYFICIWLGGTAGILVGKYSFQFINYLNTDGRYTNSNNQLTKPQIEKLAEIYYLKLKTKQIVIKFKESTVEYNEEYLPGVEILEEIEVNNLKEHIKEIDRYLTDLIIKAPSNVGTTFGDEQNQNFYFLASKSELKAIRKEFRAANIFPYEEFTIRVIESKKRRLLSLQDQEEFIALLVPFEQGEPQHLSRQINLVEEHKEIIIEEKGIERPIIFSNQLRRNSSGPELETIQKYIACVKGPENKSMDEMLKAHQRKISVTEENLNYFVKNKPQDLTQMISSGKNSPAKVSGREIYEKRSSSLEP
ncbi:MAG: hypothetical protein JWM09_52 [Francisellaceae bacterium]|nr:hypothetical protein [Francisellaceae bacterium]